MQIQNNSNNTFTGLGIIGKVKAENLSKLNKYVSNGDFISKVSYLERIYNTDLFFNTKVSKITLKHKEYGDLTKFGLQKFTITEFMEKHEFVMNELNNALELAKTKRSNYLKWLELVLQG